MNVVHTGLKSWSDERMHILDDLATCWCHPSSEEVDGVLLVTHRRVDTSGHDALGSIA